MHRVRVLGVALALLCGCGGPSATRSIERGDELLVEGKTSDAIAAYSQAIKVDPKNVDAHFSRGMAHEISRKWAEAVSDYRQAIQLDPKHGQAHNSLAWVLCTCPDAAVRDGKQAMEHARRSREFESDWMFDDTLAAAHEVAPSLWTRECVPLGRAISGRETLPRSRAAAGWCAVPHSLCVLFEVRHSQDF